MEKDVNKDDVRVSEMSALDKAVKKLDELRIVFMQEDVAAEKKLYDIQRLIFKHQDSADQQTAALRKEVERLTYQAELRWVQLSELAETNKRLESHMDSYILENAKLESELTTLRSEKGLANVLPTDGEIERMAHAARFHRNQQPNTFEGGAKQIRDLVRDRLQNQSPEKSPNDGGWISVEKEPPVDSGDVLITNENGFLATGWYDHDNKVWFASEGASVSHWRPLPPPPAIQQ